MSSNSIVIGSLHFEVSDAMYNLVVAGLKEGAYSWYDSAQEGVRVITDNGRMVGCPDEFPRKEDFINEEEYARYREGFHNPGEIFQLRAGSLSVKACNNSRGPTIRFVTNDEVRTRIRNRLSKGSRHKRIQESLNRIHAILKIDIPMGVQMEDGYEMLADRLEEVFTYYKIPLPEEGPVIGYEQLKGEAIVTGDGIDLCKADGVVAPQQESQGNIPENEPVVPTLAPNQLKTAIGTKVIRFEPMTQKEFFEKFKRNTGDITPQNLEGYHVQYDNPDGAVYDSWSPKAVFDGAYQSLDCGIAFGGALFFLKQGKKVARKGWNGKGMWIKVVECDHYSIIENKVDFNMGDGREEWNLLPWIGMKTADNKFVPWLASQTDILAEDWMVIE